MLISKWMEHSNSGSPALVYADMMTKELSTMQNDIKINCKPNELYILVKSHFYFQNNNFKKKMN